MTEIMPVPRNLNFTVLPAGSLNRLFLFGSKQRKKNRTEKQTNKTRVIPTENRLAESKAVKGGVNKAEKSLQNYRQFTGVKRAKYA